MNRDQIIQWVIVNDEGGLVDAPGDPGGRTNKGISQRFLDAIRPTDAGPLPATVDELDDANIARLYVTYFWVPIQGDKLPPGLALMMMDMAVNQGPPTAVMTLQQAVGVHVDARLGSVTLSALAGMGSKALPEFTARRAVHYAQLNASEGQFELGWMRRLIRVYDVASNA